MHPSRGHLRKPSYLRQSLPPKSRSWAKCTLGDCGCLSSVGRDDKCQGAGVLTYERVEEERGPKVKGYSQSCEPCSSTSPDA